MSNKHLVGLTLRGQSGTFLHPAAFFQIIGFNVIVSECIVYVKSLSLICNSFLFRFGRKKVIFISLAAQCVSVLLQSFSQSWRTFCIMFLFVGASQISLYISAFVLGMNLSFIIHLLLCFYLSIYQFIYLNCKPLLNLCLSATLIKYLDSFLNIYILSRTGTEVLSKTMRVIFTSLGAFLFYCIGYMTLPWIAYGIREWRTLLAVLSMTAVVYIPLWWYGF